MICDLSLHVFIFMSSLGWHINCLFYFLPRVRRQVLTLYVTERSCLSLNNKALVRGVASVFLHVQYEHPHGVINKSSYSSRFRHFPRTPWIAF